MGTARNCRTQERQAEKGKVRARISPFVKRFVAQNFESLDKAKEEYDGACIEFAGDLTDSTPGARLAYFEGIAHPAWRYHAAMEFGGWVHDLWLPMMPLDVFMSAIGAAKVEYPAEDMIPEK